jgi:inhibitor of KinA sporulation pathway (predicted exonuclease)
MAIERDTVVIVDVESTCWENEKAPSGEISEIIEIGVCTLDIATRQPHNKRSIFVKPSMSKISPFCTGLTTITPEMVAEHGISFADACAILRDEYKTESRLWLSWGNYDQRMFAEQCPRMVVDYPFSDKHCNLKNRFANYYGKRMGMERALRTIDLKLEGTHHRGGDDAWNIARILASMLDKHGQDVLETYW